MTFRTTISIQDEEVADMFRRRRDERDMSSGKYLRFLMEEATVSHTRNELIEQTEQLNEQLRRVISKGDTDEP